MKKQDLPQDESNLKSANMTEVLYVTDENDNYTTANSIGWEAKKAALEELIANTPRWPSGCFSSLQQRLAKADSITAADQIANTEALRTLAIRAEIITGQESPASDKQARMVYQVQQMQQGFGQRDTHFEPLLIEWISLAGVDTAEYTSLLQRFNACRIQGVAK